MIKRTIISPFILCVIHLNQTYNFVSEKSVFLALRAQCTLNILYEIIGLWNISNYKTTPKRENLIWKKRLHDAGQQRGQGHKTIAFWSYVHLHEFTSVLKKRSYCMDEPHRILREKENKPSLGRYWEMRTGPLQKITAVQV